MTTTIDASENWVDTLFDAVLSDVAANAYIDKVNSGEPRTGTPTGVSAGVWVQRIRPVGMLSGLDASSGVVVFQVRLYTSVLMEPVDLIEPNLLKANSSLMRQWHDNFDFGLHPMVRNVDLLGETNYFLDSEAGYIRGEDDKAYRCYTITLPVIVNDMWTQNGGA